MQIRINTVIVLVLSTFLIFAGCNRSESVNMNIWRVNVVSISEDRPANVVIGVIGINSITCESTTAKVYVDRDGKTIRLSATMIVQAGVIAECVRATEVYSEVIITDLEVGEYQIVDEDSELMRLHIEADAGYVITAPIIENIEVTLKGQDGVERNAFPEDYSDPVQVTIGVSGYFDTECTQYLKANIEHHGSDHIYVDISGEVPINNTDCALAINPSIAWIDMVDPYHAWINPLYSTEILLGEFTKGHYTVVVNGMKYSFSI